MSPRRQPRSALTWCISAHQNTKNVPLLSSMNTTCMTKAPRSARAALRLVAMSARAKARDLAAIDCQGRCRPPKCPQDGDCRGTAPDHETAGKRSRRDETVPHHERRWIRQQDWKRRKCRSFLDELRVELEWHHQAAKDEHQFLPHPVHR